MAIFRVLTTHSIVRNILQDPPSCFLAHQMKLTATVHRRLGFHESLNPVCASCTLPSPSLMPSNQTHLRQHSPDKGNVAACWSSLGRALSKTLNSHSSARASRHAHKQFNPYIHPLHILIFQCTTPGISKNAQRCNIVALFDVILLW